MENRRKIRMLVLLAICLILSHSIFESVWEASDPNPKLPFHEYVIHKSHQEAHMTEKGFAPSLYFLQTNKSVYMVTFDVYYQTNIGEEERRQMIYKKTEWEYYVFCRMIESLPHHELITGKLVTK